MAHSIPPPEELLEIRKTHPRAYEPWKQDEVDDLATDWQKFLQKEQGMPLDFAGFVTWAVASYGRNPGAIKSRLSKLGGKDPDRVSKAKTKLPKQRKQLSSTPEIELNSQIKETLALLNGSNQNVFITGRAGTGKSTLLNYFRSTTEKQVVVLAPTGVAALNVEGQTVHSFCGFPADITVGRVKQLKPWQQKRKLLQKLDTIIIDEISMVRADLLDCLDKFLRLNGKVKEAPFGGYQLVFIGDLYQLPPVESTQDESEGNLLGEYLTPYFFDSHVFGQIDCHMIELEKVYRQKDHEFIALLNAVRDNRAMPEDLEKLNRQVNSDFQFEEGDLVISLTTTNARANAINQNYLEQLTGEAKKYRGRINGDFLTKRLPTEEVTLLRIGSQVMLLNNDIEGRWVNGTMGKILAFEKQEEQADIILVELEDGTTCEVEPYTWEFFKYVFDSETNRIESEVIGSFTQYPIKLAWAVTIHKGQGKTFSKVHIDLGNGTFAHGQLYVALSRCRTLEGITLERPIHSSDIKLDARVVSFLNNFKAKTNGGF